MGAERSIGRIEALFDWILGEHAGARDVWGIGLSIPGPVEHANGRLASKPVLHLPGWQDFPVREQLTGRYGARVWIDSEVHLMALGELRAGRGVGSDDLLFVKVGTEISAGLCSSGRVHRGAHGYAGDIGHISVMDDSAVICRCGNTGCLEALAGGGAIAVRPRLPPTTAGASTWRRKAAGGSAITAADVGMGAHRGDPFCVELLSHAGGLIGGTLAAVVNAYNPSFIVVGGGVAQAGEILLAAMREALYRRSRSLATQNLQIVRSEMGKTAGLVGAALAVIDELFVPETVRGWIEQGSPTRRAESIERTPRGAPLVTPAEARVVSA